MSWRKMKHLLGSFPTPLHRFNSSCSVSSLNIFEVGFFFVLFCFLAFGFFQLFFWQGYLITSPT